MLKRLKQLDTAALLGQLPRTMEFKRGHTFYSLWDLNEHWATLSSYVLWDKDGHGTSITALTNAHPGLIRHVATHVDEEEDQQKWVDFVVECADGTVNACITVTVKYYCINTSICKCKLDMCQKFW
jgi:hypothetical protein